MYGNLKENGRRTMIGLARFQSIYKLVLDADIIEKRRCVTEGLRWCLGGSHFGCEIPRYDNMTNDAWLR